MNGSNDPYADMRTTQAQMWPSALETILVGKDYYGVHTTNSEEGGE